MTSALLCTTRPITASTLPADLAAAGISVLGTVDVRSFGLDLVIAKPIAFITPYIGAGGTRTSTKPIISASSTGSNLSTVNTTSARLFAGFDANLPFATLSAEAEKIGSVTAVSTKLGFKF